jgi:hypothetical protein
MQGGSTRGRLAAALALAAASGALVLAVPGVAQVTTELGVPKTKFVKGKIVTDGVFTPLQPETMQVSKLPARMKFQLLIGPPPGAGNCNAAYACEPAGVRPLPGTHGFKTSGKGRAEITFIAPEGFLRYNNLNPKARPEFVPFKHGDPIFIVLSGGVTRHKGKKLQVILGEAVARGRIEAPAAP